jgi:phenylalanyl-tRNA synthetase beta chain
MKFTRNWLLDHLETEASLTDIIDAMIKIGLEVEDVEDPADRLATITTAYVEAADKHPDADKLKVCQVQTADGEKQIVCGAPNARAGIYVAYAPVGTYIPGLDTTLSKAKIRGVESLGMLCSARELELGDDHDGIMELPEAPIGTPIANVLGLDDAVIDFEVTPNRPDTNGVDGVARDLAAAGLGRLKTETPEPVEGRFPQPIPIEIDALDACPAFAGRLIRGVRNGPSPKWLQDRLRAIGLRPINALVDITNYISYDRARPLHVYDAKKLSGPVRARMGREGESFEALDGKTYEVDRTMCVIADDDRVLGLGGVMGGEHSGSTAETTEVLIECALFDPLGTARTGRKTGIVSDARYRFERGVDPTTVMSGIELATRLVLDICGGEASEVSLAGSIPSQRQQINFPPAEVQRLTGMDISDSEKERILCELGFDVKRGGTWTVTAPTFRPDIAGKADVVEEIARIHGLESLPVELPRKLSAERRKAPAPLIVRERAVRDALTAEGYSEAITWAFCDSDAASLFNETANLKLSNPISSDLGMMRPSAFPNLIGAIKRNASRGAPRVRLFEIGGSYDSDRPDGQRTVLTAVAWGDDAETWRDAGGKPDVFGAKALALTALEACGVSIENLSTIASGPAYFHPGRKGALGLGPKNIVARFGEIHPGVLKSLDAPGPIAAVEIDLDAVPASRTKGPGKAPLRLSPLMPLTRDFAFVVDESTPAEPLLKAVRGADKALVSDVRLFDVYRGPNIPEGKKSLAIEVTLQPSERTLTDEEIDSVADRIVAQAAKASGAVLRSA